MTAEQLFSSLAQIISLFAGCCRIRWKTVSLHSFPEREQLRRGVAFRDTDNLQMWVIQKNTDLMADEVVISI